MIKRDYSNFYKYMENSTKKTKSSRENLFNPPLIHDSCEVVIRFLPQNINEPEIPGFAESWFHNFQDIKDSSWKNVSCLSQVGRVCPICAYNKKIFSIYGTGDEAKSYLLGKIKKYYYANIYVVSSPNARDTEGKIFVLRFNSQVMEKIKSYSGQAPFYDYLEGADFVYKVKATKYGNSCAESYFLAPGPISNSSRIPLTEEEIGEIDDKLFLLKPYTRDLSRVTLQQVLDKYQRHTGRSIFYRSPDYTSSDAKYVANLPNDTQLEIIVNSSETISSSESSEGGASTSNVPKANDPKNDFGSKYKEESTGENLDFLDSLF